MTTALKALDAHAQTDGHRASGEPVQDGELSSQRATEKLAMGHIAFSSQIAASTYEMDLSHVRRGP